MNIFSTEGVEGIIDGVGGIADGETSLENVRRDPPSLHFVNKMDKARGSMATPGLIHFVYKM